jgi:AcrR family transcriptional regulator
MSSARARTEQFAEPKSVRTRARILAAAQRAFSNWGYAQTSVRKIASMVGLSSTILHRYFGNKADLFEAALIEAMGEPTFPESRDQLGATLAQHLSQPDLDISPHTMTLLATGDEEAQEIAARVLHEHEVVPLANWLGAPDAEIRAQQIFSLCAGFVYHTRQLTSRSQGAEVDPKMIDWFARSVQAVVDNGGPEGTDRGEPPGRLIQTLRRLNPANEGRNGGPKRPA